MLSSTLDHNPASTRRHGAVTGDGAGRPAGGGPKHGQTAILVGLTLAAIVGAMFWAGHTPAAPEQRPGAAAVNVSEVDATGRVGDGVLIGLTVAEPRVAEQDDPTTVAPASVPPQPVDPPQTSTEPATPPVPEAPTPGGDTVFPTPEPGQPLNTGNPVQPPVQQDGRCVNDPSACNPDTP